MLRLAHSQNYLLPSPTKEEVGGQPAMEAVPLILEPESRMYNSPVVVLDFQSLYPSARLLKEGFFGGGRGGREAACCQHAGRRRRQSPWPPAAAHHARTPLSPLLLPSSHSPRRQKTCLDDTQMVIAYNLCYSTCLGKPAHARAGSTPLRLGVAELSLPPGTLRGRLAPQRLIVAPNGVSYASHEARLGVLPRMLHEILTTRVMVKAAMKRASPADKARSKWQRRPPFAAPCAPSSFLLTPCSAFSLRARCLPFAASHPHALCP